jgi:O-antigen ligase
MSLGEGPYTGAPDTEVRRLGDKGLPLVQVFGIYLFLLLMFGGRFGTFRELGLYLPSFLWLFQGIIRKNFGVAWREPLLIGILGLSLSAVLSTLLSTAPFHALVLLKREYLKILLLYFVISATFAYRERLNRLAFFIALVGILYLCVGFYKIFGDLLESGNINYDQTRYYATVFLFFFPFFLLRSICTEGLKRVLWTLPLMGSMAGILLIGVRGSWLALFGVVCIWLYFLREKSSAVFVVLKRAVPVILLALVIVFILFPGQLNMIKERTVQKVQLSLRFETWNIFLIMAKDRFLTGHGIDDAAMRDRFRAEFRRVRGENLAEGIQPTTPHNQFIKILYQQGIVGLMLYCALFIVLTYRTVETFRMHREGAPLFIGTAVFSVIIGEYVIRCLTEDRSLVPLGFLLGMAGAYLRQRNEPPEEKI